MEGLLSKSQDPASAPNHEDDDKPAPQRKELSSSPKGNSPDLDVEDELRNWNLQEIMPYQQPPDSGSLPSSPSLPLSEEPSAEGPQSANGDAEGAEIMDPPRSPPPKEIFIPDKSNHARHKGKLSSIKQGRHKQPQKSSSARLGYENNCARGLDGSSRRNNTSRDPARRRKATGRSSSFTHGPKIPRRKSSNGVHEDSAGRDIEKISTKSLSSSSSLSKKKRRSRAATLGANSTSWNSKIKTGSVEKQRKKKLASLDPVAFSNYHDSKKNEKEPTRSREVGNEKNEKNSESMYGTSYNTILAAISKAEVGASSCERESPDEFLSRKTLSSDDKATNKSEHSENGTNEDDDMYCCNRSKKHPSRVITMPLQKEVSAISLPNEDRASHSTHVSSSSSVTSKLRRYFKSFKRGNRRQSNKYEGNTKNQNTRALDQSNRKNPYAIEDNTDNARHTISSIDEHDVCLATSVIDGSIDHDRSISDLPSMIMTPNLSKHNINSSSHHNHSLLSISEHDVLRDSLFHSNHHLHPPKEELNNHSSHSDGGILRGRDNLRLSTHSEGAAMTMARSGSFRRQPRGSHGRLSSNLDMSFNEGSFDVNMNNSLHTNYSTNIREPIALNVLYSKILAMTANDNTTYIINLPWSESGSGNDPSEKIQGTYSGPVDRGTLQPHGEGTLVMMGQEFYGFWKSGRLASHLTAEPGAGVHSESASVAASGSDTPHGFLQNSPIIVKSRGRHAQNNKGSLPHNTNTGDKGDVNIKYVMNKIGKQIKSVSDETELDRPRSYNLGDCCRTPSDMIIHRSDQGAIQSTALLKKWDQAFIKRSNGLWTVAVMVDRAQQPKHISRHGHDMARWSTVWDIDPLTMKLEESMLFVINEDGATKVVNRKSWGKYIRRIKA